MGHAYDPSTGRWVQKDPGVQGPLQLCEEYGTSLGYIRPCIKNQNTRQGEVRILCNLGKLQGGREVNRDGSPGACWLQGGTGKEEGEFLR